MKKLGLLFVLLISIASIILLSLISCTPDQYNSGIPAEYNLDISISPEGAGTITPSGGKYVAGTEVTLVAKPAPSYFFDHWDCDLGWRDYNPFTITMNHDTSLTAYFLAKYNVTASANPSNGGTVKVFPASGPFDPNSTVTIYAYPASGYVFDSWDIHPGCNAAGSDRYITFKINNDQSVVAHFTEASKTPPASITLPERERGGNLVILNHEAVKKSGTVILRGQAKNIGGTSIDCASIQVTWFDTTKKLLCQQSNWLYDIGPGETRNFEWDAMKITLVKKEMNLEEYVIDPSQMAYYDIKVEQCSH